MSKSVAALAFVLALPALPAAAQFSPGEYQEHPVVKLYPGAAVDLHDDKPFDVAQIATDIKGGALVLGPVEGRVTRYTYLHGPGVSALQVLRNFEAALAKEGFRTLTVAQVSTLPQLQDQHLSRAYFGAFRLDRGGAPALYVNIAVDPNGDEPRSDLVIVQPAARPGRGLRRQFRYRQDHHSSRVERGPDPGPRSARRRSLPEAEDRGTHRQCRQAAGQQGAVGGARRGGESVAGGQRRRRRPPHDRRAG